MSLKSFLYIFSGFVIVLYFIPENSESVNGTTKGTVIWFFVFWIFVMALYYRRSFFYGEVDEKKMKNKRDYEKKFGHKTDIHPAYIEGNAGIKYIVPKD